MYEKLVKGEKKMTFSLFAQQHFGLKYEKTGISSSFYTYACIFMQDFYSQPSHEPFKLFFVRSSKTRTMKTQRSTFFKIAFYIGNKNAQKRKH